MTTAVDGGDNEDAAAVDADVMHPARRKLIRMLKDAATKALAQGDPWAHHGMERIPAERVIRHLFQPETKTWTCDETIVKMEPHAFTHGAMRFCYRLKKRATPPQSASNHHFHSKLGWNQAACNYIAKAYLLISEKTCCGTTHGEIDEDEATASSLSYTLDTSPAAKEAVRNDIALQYEASHWAQRFNELGHPPKSIIFIRAYAMEFPDRPGRPWFAVERFIAGQDVFGAGFTKHNTNSGFVDEELHRVTPQTFSAFSFYDSEGERLVADIQGVGDLYTDPQVLSSDYRFGDGDLGPRGMALFFKTFRHNTLADSMGIPVFALSKNELVHQAKYEDDEYSAGDNDNDSSSYASAIKGLDRFAALDVNRSRRQSVLLIPPREILPEDMQSTERHSNQSKIREDIRKSLRMSFSTRNNSRSSHKCMQHKPVFSRSTSEVDEVHMCLELAKEDFRFDHKVYHRKASGELITTTTSNKNENTKKRSSLLVRQISDPMPISAKTRANLGRVHYQLAVLHGMGRFPEVVPVPAASARPSINGTISDDDDDDLDDTDIPPHDAFSVLYHLAHAASMNCVPACLALGRLHAGLGTSVSTLLQNFVPVDFERAKDLLRRAMQSPYPPAAPKAAAGCFLYQVYLDERESDDLEDEKASDATIMQLIQDILHLLDQAAEEKKELESHQIQQLSTRAGGGGTAATANFHETRFHPGDRVEGNYCLEGTYYGGVIESVSPDGMEIRIQYDDDGSIETLGPEHVRLIIPAIATQTALGGPLSDEQALGAENSDEQFLVEVYELKAELGELKAAAGDKEGAAALLDEASNDAMLANKMKRATELSLKAAELLET